jgi:hypothetical protein
MDGILNIRKFWHRKGEVTMKLTRVVGFATLAVLWILFSGTGFAQSTCVVVEQSGDSTLVVSCPDGTSRTVDSGTARNYRPGDRVDVPGTSGTHGTQGTQGSRGSGEGNFRR